MSIQLIPDLLITIINDDTLIYCSSEIGKDEKDEIDQEARSILCSYKHIEDINCSEVQIRNNLSFHPHIECFYGVTESNLLLTENITAKSLVHALDIIGYNIELIWSILIEVATGMSHLHSYDIWYQNLNLSNIRFRYQKSKYKTVLTNFGNIVLSKDGKRNDMHDFGTVIFQSIQKIPIEEIPPSIIDIIAQCQNSDPNLRPSFDENFIASMKNITFISKNNSSWNLCRVM